MDVENLIQEHKDSVYRQLVRACGNYDDAEDALIESLVTAYQAADSLEHPEAFRGWVGTIASRVCGKIRRKDKLRSAIPLDDVAEILSVEPEADSLSDHAQMKSCISHALDSLEPIYREVYEHRDLLGLSTSETAKKLDLTEAAVKSRLHRARLQIRDALDTSVCGDLTQS